MRYIIRSFRTNFLNNFENFGDVYWLIEFDCFLVASGCHVWRIRLDHDATEWNFSDDIMKVFSAIASYIGSKTYARMRMDVEYG